jgi:glycosyltransferase involved in cell wall biosynthesis
VSRLLVVTEAGDAFPSGVIRAMIYRDLFAGRGYHAEFASRLLPPLRRWIETPPRAAAPLVTGQPGRIVYAAERAIARVRERGLLARAAAADVVYLAKVTSHPFIAALRARTRARLVLDIVDALWLPRYGNARFAETLALVDAVTTDNEVTADGIRRFGRVPITVIPDSPQIEMFDARRSGVARRQDVVTIGWVGSPGTTYNLWTVWEALERVFAQHGPVHLRLLGADPRALPPFERVRWTVTPRYSQADMIDEVLAMDIGLFPLQDVEACRTRGVLKAAVYMSGGAAVVASPVGLTPRLVEDGVTGLLADTAGEWTAAIERLIAEPALRARLAQAGLERVRREFTVQRAFETLCGVLDPARESDSA